MFTLKCEGDWSKTGQFLQKILRKDFLKVLDKYGEQGVDALMSATPKDSGNTAAAWYYEVIETETGAALSFNNANIVDGWFKVAIMLDVGHGTRNGGYVKGREYIDPVIQPIFDDMAESIWLEVTKS